MRAQGALGSNAGPFNQCASGTVEPVLVGAFGQLTRNFLSKLHAELIERIDAGEHGIGKGPMLVKGDESAKRTRIQPIEQDGRARPVAGVGTMWIVTMAALHQRRALGEGIQKKKSVVFRVLRIIALAHGHKLNRYEHRTLVEQLEDRMLRIDSNASP